MDFNTFKTKHSEIICYCQIIEGDLKWIYSYLKNGNVLATRESLGNLSLGQIVSELKKLSLEGKAILSDADFNFLYKLTDKRNYWCHECFRDFVYTQNWPTSTQYETTCQKLLSDHNQFHIVCKNIETLKLKLKR